MQIKHILEQKVFLEFFSYPCDKSIVKEKEIR